MKHWLVVAALIINPMWTIPSSPVWTMNETHTPNSAGTITLNWAPKSVNSTACYQNGLRLVPGYDYALTGQNVSALSPHVPFSVTDIMLCDYYH